MAIQLSQTIQQRLLMAPNITMALEILRMPTMELHAFLQQQIEANPLLELDEDYDEATEEALAENGAEDPPSPSLEEEWSDQWQQAGGMAGGEPEDPAESPGNDLRYVKPPSLCESLRTQLGCQQITEDQRRLGEALIDRLNENGYLEDPLEALAGEIGATPEQLEDALQLVQQLDPPGVGARDLRECLVLQLERQPKCSALAHRIVKDHFKLFVQHRLTSLARVTGAEMAEVQRACECLKQLNPKPGRAFAGELPPSIIPDLIIHQREEHYDVELNDDEVPRLRVNRHYHRMLRASDTPMEVKEFLQDRFRRAGWVIKAIEERNATLLAIARCLISLQRDFVEHGPKALKPLTQAQVATLVGRHASTVSRAMTGKTIDTPYGVFRLEQLFASGVPQAGENGHVSDETIKSEIQRLIDQEDAQRPLSDTALADLLIQREISVARRTIAKYRTSLKILPAHLRKRRF